MTNFVEIQSRAARLTEDHLRSKASTMTFTIAPEPVDDANGPFKWKGRCYHLTYSSFIEKADLLATVRRATTIRLEGWSYVSRVHATNMDGVHIMRDAAGCRPRSL